MLYDPKWERDSLVGLRNWLAKQPADDQYQWHSCATCVVGKYLKAQGISPMEYATWCDNVPGAKRAIPESFSTGWLNKEQNTMGRALERLDAWMLANMATV